MSRRWKFTPLSCQERWEGNAGSRTRERWEQPGKTINHSGEGKTSKPSAVDGIADEEGGRRGKTWHGHHGRHHEGCVLQILKKDRARWSKRQRSKVRQESAGKSGVNRDVGRTSELAPLLPVRGGVCLWGGSSGSHTHTVHSWALVTSALELRLPAGTTNSHVEESKPACCYLSTGGFPPSQADTKFYSN